MFRLFFALLILAVSALNPVFAQQSRALVVLRFNQPQVFYEQPLYDAVAKAVALKPTVMFDVVSYAPYTGNPPYDAAWKQTASHNTRAVVSSMQRMGISASQIRVSGQQQPGITFDEVHIYVR